MQMLTAVGFLSPVEIEQIGWNARECLILINTQRDTARNSPVK